MASEMHTAGRRIVMNLFSAFIIIQAAIINRKQDTANVGDIYRYDSEASTLMFTVNRREANTATALLSTSNTYKTRIKARIKKDREITDVIGSGLKYSLPLSRNLQNHLPFDSS